MPRFQYLSSSSCSINLWLSLCRLDGCEQLSLTLGDVRGLGSRPGLLPADSRSLSGLTVEPARLVLGAVGVVQSPPS